MESSRLNYFKPEELACKCGTCDLKPSQLLLDKLNQLRFLYKKPIVVTSGVRCPKQNAKAGGVMDSEHLTGEGVDIRCETSQERFQLLRLALSIFDRVGIDARFLHLGVSTSHPPEVVWLYPAKSTGAASGSAPKS